jgi:hypothetical protein
MLRFGYMPSDFNPIFLFLGDAADLSQLAVALRKFEGAPQEIVFESRAPNFPRPLRMAVRPADEGFGMRSIGEGEFAWRLNAWQAGRIAEQIELLTLPEKKSGSEVVELGVDGEIPVKISRGEFTDDFLTKKM